LRKEKEKEKEKRKKKKEKKRKLKQVVNISGFDSCTTPIQQLYNNLSYEGGPQYVGLTLM
jgi:hypothetical protein